MNNDHIKVWNACLQVIKDNLPLQAFKTWFEPILPVRLDEAALTIQVPSHFFYEWLEENYIDLLRKVIRKELGPDGRLEYSIVMENNATKSTPYTVKLPALNKKSLKNQPVNMPLNIAENQIRNPFIIPGLKKVNVESIYFLKQM